MKTETVFKRTYNAALDLVAKLEDEAEIPSVRALGERFDVSRTTVRKVLSHLREAGIIRTQGVRCIVTSAQKALGAKRYAEAETVPLSAQVERRFMEWMLRDNARPGTFINELDLARLFGVATSSVREFLNRFQHYGLIEKRPNSGWVFGGFTIDFALELFEIREMFELRSARAFVALPEDSPLWDAVVSLRLEHRQLLSEVDRRYHDFSDLDSRFHRLINAAAANRFIDDFYDIITLIFHYHYQWNKQDERGRNEVAIAEHLTYIEALLTRNAALVDLACRAHLASARETLIRATSSLGQAAGEKDKRQGIRALPSVAAARVPGERL